jgi:hypothetical protein
VDIDGQGFTPGGVVLAEVYDVTGAVYPNGNEHYLYADNSITIDSCNHIFSSCDNHYISGGQFTYFYSFGVAPENVRQDYPPCGDLMRVRAYDYQQAQWSNVLYYVTCQ